jgi:hypothetical protein
MGRSAAMSIWRASTTLCRVPPAIAFVARSTRAHQSSGSRWAVTVNRRADASGPPPSELAAVSDAMASVSAASSAGVIVVIQRVPSSARPATTAGTTSSLGAPGMNGRLPKATGPQPGNLTSSSTSMPARASATERAAAPGSLPGHATRAAQPRPAIPERPRSNSIPSRPARCSRSTSASIRRVRASSAVTTPSWRG